MFLKNLQTENIKPQHVLINHLNYDELFNNRIQGLHKNAKMVLHRSKTFDEFIKSVDNVYAKNKNYSDAINVKETLLCIWNKHKGVSGLEV
jgi:hypothetical protein